MSVTKKRHFCATDHTTCSIVLYCSGITCPHNPPLQVLHTALSWGWEESVRRPGRPIQSNLNNTVTAMQFRTFTQMPEFYIELTLVTCMSVVCGQWVPTASPYNDVCRDHTACSKLNNYSRIKRAHHWMDLHGPDICHFHKWICLSYHSQHVNVNKQTGIGSRRSGQLREGSCIESFSRYYAFKSWSCILLSHWTVIMTGLGFFRLVIFQQPCLVGVVFLR